MQKMPTPPINELEQIQKLHDYAMDQAEAAMLCQMRGDLEGFHNTIRSGLEHERDAANRLVPYTAYEPSRSALHLSAASLALELKEWRLAEQLACAALAGSPPDEIVIELREILEHIYKELNQFLMGTSKTEVTY